jgi:subtilisin-like proprotein convertase family protein
MNRVPRVRASIAAVVTLAGLVVGATGGPAAADAGTFSTSTPVTIQDPALEITNSSPLSPPDNTPSGVSSSVQVSDQIGEVDYVSVDLTGLTHASPDDLDITLVAPNGTAVPLLSDSGGTAAVGPIDVSIDDAAQTPAPDNGPLVEGATYQPTDDEPGEVRPSGSARSDTSLQSLAGSDPNGTWTLYVADDSAGATGSIGGWTLYLAQFPSSDPFPSAITVSGLPTAVSDVDVTLTGLTHSYPDDLDLVLVAPDGTSSTIMSDAGGGQDNGLADATIHLDDQASNPLPDESPIISGDTYRPQDYDDDADDVDPPDTDGTDLGLFDGTDPNGDWHLYVLDDGIGDVGTLAGWSLIITTPAPPVTPTINPQLASVPLDDVGTTISGTGGPGDTITLTGLDRVRQLVVGSDGAWSIPSGPMPDGGYNLTAVASNRYGQVRSSTPVHVTFARIPPAGTVTIRTLVGAPDRTCRRAVLLKVSSSSPNLVGLRVSNDGGPLSPLINFGGGAAEIPWTLTDHDGVRRIFVQFQNARGDVSSNMSTTVVLDRSHPTVAQVWPRAGATGVRRGTVIRAALSEATLADHVTHGGVLLYRVGSKTPVEAQAKYDTSTHTIALRPARRLRSDTRYRAVVTTVIRDIAANVLDQDPVAAGYQPMAWRFRTR